MYKSRERSTGPDTKAFFVVYGIYLKVPPYHDFVAHAWNMEAWIITNIMLRSV